ncbi:centromere protein F-like isoform X2 [Gopherus evgoodei]|uniref:centromere protein F-like isoform X2 n=1 Tax=Gopherus evgoodei TaxID=1825980 RepID=UPI0011CF03E4|nr:centromere protein F-like isoform X2 [Gopherus evgoodei]
MLERKMDALLSHQRQFVEKNRLSLEQKIKEKEKEVFRQLHDLLAEDLQCEQIKQDLQQANNTLQAELDKSAQKSEKIHLLEEELKTIRHFLKETQNYAEEMKNKNLSQEIQLEKKQAETRDLEGKNQDLIQQLEKVQSDLQFKQAEIAHLQNLSSAELRCLKQEMLNIKAEQKKLQEQHNILLQENEQLSKEMKGKNLLSLQSAQKSEKIHLLEEELKTIRHFLKETQNYAEEMKNKNLSQEIQLEKKQAETRDLEGKNQDLIQQLEKVQSDLQFKQAEIAHLQNLSSAELPCLKQEKFNIKAEQKKLPEQHNILLQENEQLSKLDNLKSIVDLKKQNVFAHSKLKTWMKSCADEVAIYLLSLTQDNEPEYEPDKLPEVVRKGFADIPTGKTNPYVLHRTALNLRTSPHLAAQSHKLSPYDQSLQNGRSDNLAEISKLAAGGSTSPKVDDTQQCQAETTIEPVESRSRSPLCMNKQPPKAVAENSRENLNTHQDRCSLSTQKLPDQSEQDKNCMVQ